MSLNYAFYGEKLFPEENQHKIVAYQYRGSDRSILYKHVFGKFSQFLVDEYVPEWMAPNLITTVSFIFSVIPHILLILAYGFSLKTEVSTSFNFCFIVCIFCYMVGAIAKS